MADNDMSRDFYLLLDKLNNKVPFSFAYFNDGEMAYILDSSRGTISRGYQSYSDELKEQLKKSFLINNKDFYRGIPCSTCYPNLRSGAISLLEDNHTICSTVKATIFHNSFVTTHKLVFESLKKYTITWVISEKANVEKICDHIGIDKNKSKTIIVPSNNAFGTQINDNFDTELVIFLCGPLGRVLAGSCFEKYPDKTFLSLGSYFDYISGTFHNYHLSNDSSLCPECFFSI